jgi:hypothetical protein
MSFANVSKIRILVVLSLTMLCVAAHAETWFTSTIAYVYPFADGSFVLVFDDDSPSCQHASKYHRVAVNQNSVTEEGKRMMYASALAAKASGSRLSIAFDESNGNCYVNRLKMLD